MLGGEAQGRLRPVAPRVGGSDDLVGQRHHRRERAMQGLYIGACVIAGGFTLHPDRLLGNLIWGQWLGLA